MLSSGWELVDVPITLQTPDSLSYRSRHDADLRDLRFPVALEVDHGILEGLYHPSVEIEGEPSRRSSIAPLRIIDRWD